MSAWGASMHMEWKIEKKNDFCSLGGICYMRNITLLWLPNCGGAQALNLYFVYKRRGRNCICMYLFLHSSFLIYTCKLEYVTRYAVIHFCPEINEHMFLLLIGYLQISCCNIMHACHYKNPQIHTTVFVCTVGTDIFNFQHESCLRPQIHTMMFLLFWKILTQLLRCDM